MTVYIEKPSLNLREELASLRNQGGYEEQQFYFDGLVTNGTFDADTDWTKGTGWTISGGVASSDGSQTATSDLSQILEITVSIGQRFAVTYTVSGYSAGTVRSVFGNDSGSSVTANGTYTDYYTVTTTSSTFKIRASSDFVGSVDNVSIFEPDASNDVVHRMPKGWVPLHVYEDGLLQREGAAHDYEVVYDGFDYYVKPAVAPSATTQTCVIGVRK